MTTATSPGKIKPHHAAWVTSNPNLTDGESSATSPGEVAVATMPEFLRSVELPVLGLGSNFLERVAQ